jgi:membrane fusion protein (multidrug efflux system)
MNAVSQSDLDAALAQRDAAEASVEAAEASLRAARIELGYTRIYSPIDGVIGKTEAHPGDFVGRGVTQTALNEVSRIDTILVNFHIPEEQYLTITRPLLEKKDTLHMVLNEPRRNLTLILADGTQYPELGKLRFANRQVNATTGTILLQADFANPTGLLRPGQFARVKANVDLIEDGLLIPQRCVTELQGTYSVYVVNSENKVESREIEVGPTFGEGMWIVTNGLEAGEHVIYEGLLQVSSGMEVRPELKKL